MSSSSDPVGWGVIGPGRFAREFAEELARVESARLVAVASRSLEKAEAFAEEFGFERAFGNYDALFAEEEVEVVYIVVPHVFHRPVAEEAIAAGKAVLCEKPLTPTASDSRALIDTARRKGVLLMEAMKTGFLPAVQRAKEWIETGEIGEVRLAKSDFCFAGPTDPEDRLMNPALAGGAVLDVGIYPIYLTRFLLGEVISLCAEGTLAETGVEDSAAILAKHESGASSVMTCSFRTEEAMEARVYGTRGEIVIPKFHAATRVELWREGKVVETEDFPNSGMVRAEIEGFIDSFRSGHLENPLHRHEDSIRLAEIMDEVRERLGAKNSE